MSEIKSTSAVNINNANKGKKHTTFAAVTPMQKKEIEVKKQMAYLAGKYVVAECSEIGEYDKVSGLLVCLVKRGGTATYYCIMDENRNIKFVPILYYELHTIPGDIPMMFSVLEYIRQRETDFLVDKATDTIENEGYTPITRITINWKKQYGQQNEKLSTNNKANNKKNNKSVNRK